MYIQVNEVICVCFMGGMMVKVFVEFEHKKLLEILFPRISQNVN